MPQLNWLPMPNDFKQGLGEAIACASPEQSLIRLADLAKTRLGYLETIQLDSALRKTATAANSDFDRVRLAILSSVTIDHLAPPIRVAGLRRKILVDVFTGSFGQYRQELLDAASPLRSFVPQFVLLSLSPHEALAGIPLDASSDEADHALSSAVTELRELWRNAQQSFRASVIQQSFLNVYEPLWGSFERFVPGSPSRLVSRLNELCATAASQDGVLWLDIASATARDGIDAWFDTGRWLQGKFEIAPQSAPLYGELVARLIGALRGQSKKCLVLDLDNTLWSGVIGDDGLEGIRLGAGSAVGEAHAAFQRYTKQLKDRGVILAVCSKNDPAIAESVFREHTEMVLRRSDIAAFAANWSDKVENLRAIAEQLNIGLESLVFVDDNPVERARVRDALPMIAVPEMPADAAHYARCIADAGYFEAVAFTAEDRERSTQYAANAEREVLRSESASVDDFLCGLEMTVVFGAITPADVARTAQLINKTNQFNTTTRRCSPEEVAGIAAAPQNITLQFRLIDRFGDNGLVSAMLVNPLQEDSDTFEIMNWVMSCRVFGRRLEHEAMNIAVEEALRRGARELRADYVPTKKNTVIKGLFESLGFSRVQSNLQNDTSRWLLVLSDYVAHETHISRRGTA